MVEEWQIRYLDEVMAVTKMKLSKIAGEAKVSPTTLTRPYNNPNHNFTIKQTTLQAVERATGVPLAPFLGDALAPSDPDLQEIVDLWSELTPEIRQVLRTSARVHRDALRQGRREADEEEK